MDDKTKNSNFDISQFLQNAYKHPNFIDEKPIEETKESIRAIERSATNIKRFKNPNQKNEQVDSTIDIPNMV